AGRDEGKQPCAAIEPRRKCAQLRGSANKGVALGRQVMADFSCRAPQVGDVDDAIRLVGIRRRSEWRAAAFAQLVYLDWLLDPFESEMAVAFELCSCGKRLGD